MVFIPKFRRKALFGVLLQSIGPVFRELAQEIVRDYRGACDARPRPHAGLDFTEVEHQFFFLA